MQIIRQLDICLVLPDLRRVVTKDVCAAKFRILLLKYIKVSTGEALKDAQVGLPSVCWSC